MSFARVRSRRSRARRGALDARQRFDLLAGPLPALPGDEPFANERARRAAWDAHRDELVAFTIRRADGSRPAAFWEFEGPLELAEPPERPDPRLLLADEETAAPSEADRFAERRLRYLAEAGLLEPGELEAMRVHALRWPGSHWGRAWAIVAPLLAPEGW